MGRRRKTPRDTGTPQNSTTHPPEISNALQQHPIYNTLDADKDIIRVVRVHRQANDSTSVVFTLEEHPIDSAPEYTAVSYMWGPEVRTGSIEIDRRKIRVRQNLYDFLRIVVIDRTQDIPGHTAYNSMHEDPEFFWVDTLCINQNNVHERNHQVQMMGRIYNLAKTVFV
jgi:hypothetical protein